MELDIISFLRNKCKKFEALSFINDSDGRDISYRDFWTGVTGTSRLMKAAGVSPGCRFSVALPNSAEFLYLVFGGIAARGIAVNLNPAMSKAEFEYRFDDAGVDLLFTTAAVAEKLEHVLQTRKIRCVIVRGGIEELKLPDVSADHIDLTGWSTSIGKLDQGVIDPKQTAFLQYTGGTTGTIKAAMICHTHVLASVSQMSEHLAPRLRQGKETFLVTFPFYHVFSMVFQVLTAMQHGSRIVLYPYVRDLPLLASLMERIPFTVFVGVHTLYKWMLQHPVLSTLRYPEARLFIAGAEHVLPQTKERWKAATGHIIIEGYGLTETSALACMSLLNPSDNDFDAIGKPLPRTEMQLRDEDDRVIESIDQPGEICIKGPQVVAAYWNKPVENEATFSNGWLRTGDIAIRKANGQYKIIDRKKDMINVSGFNVYPNEIESVIMQLEGMTDCAAVAIPDERSGERVAAFIVAHQPLSTDAVIDFCRTKLSAYKVPVKIFQIDAIPKSPVGKTLRMVLRKQLREQQAG